jgi:hypothetical protein
MTCYFFPEIAPPEREKQSRLPGAAQSCVHHCNKGVSKIDGRLRSFHQPRPLGAKTAENFDSRVFCLLLDKIVASIMGEFVGGCESSQIFF